MITKINRNTFHKATGANFKEIKKVPKNGKKIFESKSGSVYYTNPTKTRLIRVSDHGSFYNKKEGCNGVSSCGGNIKVSSDKKVKIGVVNFSAMKFVNNESDFGMDKGFFGSKNKKMKNLCLKMSAQGKRLNKMGKGQAI